MALADMGKTLPQGERGMLFRIFTALWLSATDTAPVFDGVKATRLSRSTWSQRNAFTLPGRSVVSSAKATQYST